MRSAEQSLLREADRLLEAAAAEVAPDAERHEARFLVLEAVAATHAGWEVHEFWTRTQGSVPKTAGDVQPWADKLLPVIAGTEIPVSLAVSALAREVLTPSHRRTTGAYNTDWRLAQMLAADCVPRVTADGPWVDPACGTGILLSAAAALVPAGVERDAFIATRLCGADLSAKALRGALLSVAALTTDLDAVAAFQKRLLLQDSLRSRDTWAKVAPNGAGLVIANPPWERLRASRHEVASQKGVTRHYGQSFDAEVDLTESRLHLLTYLDAVVAGTKLQGHGEHDLYKLFLELGLGLSAEDGVLAMLVPAGFIRAQGTETLRRELFSLASELHVSVIENRRRHFAIDTRFKFLSVIGRVGGGPKQPFTLRVADRTGAFAGDPVDIPRHELEEVRHDLSFPEVRTPQEWALFTRLSKSGTTVGNPDGPWQPRYRRELDMTNDQHHFSRVPREDDLPILEGRHVGQFRSRAKAYKCGEGRAALWEPLPPAEATLRPQWYISHADLRPATLARVQRSRVGFCDITGQTNERSLLAGRIPQGVVCGNKVPTLAFPAGGEDLEDLFLALANSFTVDWMLRRVVTTTVNFFLLNSLPLPRITPDSEVGRELIDLTRDLLAAEAAEAVDLWHLGRHRARIDALISHAWGLSPADLELVLDDFPLIDRGQPTLPGETRSTITRDLVMAEFAKIRTEIPCVWTDRADNARSAGATPFVPAEYA